MSNVCLECVYCWFDLGTEDYSDVTPGEPASLKCGKKHFPEMYDLSDALAFAKVIKTAETCPDFRADSPENREETALQAKLEALRMQVTAEELKVAHAAKLYVDRCVALAGQGGGPAEIAASPLSAGGKAVGIAVALRAADEAACAALDHYRALVGLLVIRSGGAK